MDQKNTFNVNQAGIVGVNVSGNTQVSTQSHDYGDGVSASSDWDVLADELRRLTVHLKDRAATQEHFAALAELSAASEAAASKEGHGVLRRLAGVGRWVLDGARQIGARLVAEMIMKETGMK